MKTQKKILSCLTFLIFLSLSLLIACDQGTPPPTGVHGATKYLVKNIAGAAFVQVNDVNKDGKGDIVVSSFGPTKFGSEMEGMVQVLYNKFSGDLGQDNWATDVIIEAKDKVCFPNDITVYDLDKDGDNDIIVPSGFLACMANPLVKSNKWGLVWFEKTSDGSWKQHDIVPYGASINGRHKLYFHKAEIADMDNDGIEDLVTVAEIKNTKGVEYAETYIFKGDRSADRFDKKPVMIGNGGGALPTVLDVDYDGDLDIVTAQYFAYTDDPSSFVWFEREGSSFIRHTINGVDAGPSIQFSPVENLYGDGIRRYIGANHTNSISDTQWPHEAVYAFTPTNDFREFWEQTLITDQIFSKKSPMMGKMGAPGVFATGDVDGDNDIDIIVSGDGDPRIFFIEQIEPGVFETNILDDGNVGQSGVAVGDLTGDGVAEVIVSSYEANAVFVYEIDRK